MLDGNDLKSIRQSAGISQIDMAKKLECDRRTIINYEQGVCEPKASQFFKWLHFCNVNLKPLIEQLHNIKNSVFILFAIAYFTPDIMMSAYVIVTALCLIFGIFRSNGVIIFTASTLLLISLLEYCSFRALVFFLNSLESKTAWHDSSIFLTQFLLSFLALIIFINQERIIKSKYFHSCNHKSSYSITLRVTFSYFMILTFSAAVEFILNRQYSFERFDVIYTHYESLVYFGWVIIIATLITMAVDDLQSSHSKTAPNQPFF
jgi:transcriptional regulator with XRE-family HTH domain